MQSPNYKKYMLKLPDYLKKYSYDAFISIYYNIFPFRNTTIIFFIKKIDFP